MQREIDDDVVGGSARWGHAFALGDAWPTTSPVEVDADAEEDAQLDAARDATATRAHQLSYLRVVRKLPRLSAAEEFHQFNKLSSTHAPTRLAAQTALVQANLWIVPLIVRRFHRGRGFDDLMAEGNLGLFEALHRFDASRGLRFSTYAKWWVTRAVTASMAATAFACRMPRHGAVGRATPTAGQESQGDIRPSFDVVMEACVEDPQRSPDSKLALKENLQRLWQAMRGLTSREQAVMYARFGLGGDEPLTLQEVAVQLQLSVEGVRKIQLAATHKLHNALVGRKEFG
jgi:RNA polymerase sigma factor (sigma-70 family)